MSVEEPAMVLQFLKALAHESRLRLLGLVASREHSVQQLANILSLKEPTVSHHLALLREAGLVSLRQDGNTHWYHLELKALSRLAKALATREQLETFAGARINESAEDRIVRNYLTRDGRLKALPVTRKKRQPVLAWLARQFDEGRRYSEAEVNALIEQRHHDREMFRRELVGHRMLARKDGIYWRLPEVEWATKADAT
jgi:predicted transcriptional regulator